MTASASLTAFVVRSASSSGIYFATYSATPINFAVFVPAKWTADRNYIPAYVAGWYATREEAEEGQTGVIGGISQIVEVDAELSTAGGATGSVILTLLAKKAMTERSITTAVYKAGNNSHVVSVILRALENAGIVVREATKASACDLAWRFALAPAPIEEPEVTVEAEAEIVETPAIEFPTVAQVQAAILNTLEPDHILDADELVELTEYAPADVAAALVALVKAGTVSVFYGSHGKNLYHLPDEEAAPVEAPATFARYVAEDEAAPFELVEEAPVSPTVAIIREWYPRNKTAYTLAEVEAAVIELEAAYAALEAANGAIERQLKTDEGYLTDVFSRPILAENQALVNFRSSDEMLSADFSISERVARFGSTTAESYPVKTWLRRARKTRSAIAAIHRLIALAEKATAKAEAEALPFVPKTILALLEANNGQTLDQLNHALILLPSDLEAEIQIMIEAGEVTTRLSEDGAAYYYFSTSATAHLNPYLTLLGDANVRYENPNRVTPEEEAEPTPNGLDSTEEPYAREGLRNLLGQLQAVAAELDLTLTFSLEEATPLWERIRRSVETGRPYSINQIAGKVETNWMDTSKALDELVKRGLFSQHYSEQRSQTLFTKIEA